MHGSLLAFAGLIVTTAALVLLFSRYREHRKRERRRQRRARNIAYQRAWDWVMRRDRHLRITQTCGDR